MIINPDLIAPCGLYCGVCAIYIAHHDNNQKFKERLVDLYKDKINLNRYDSTNSLDFSVEDIRCRGCLSDEQFIHCRKCEIKDCTREKGYTGCHQCDGFPCQYIEDVPMPVGKKVMLRAIPYWREVGTEKWIQDEEARYICPGCGNKVFRGVQQCNRCKMKLDLD